MRCDYPPALSDETIGTVVDGTAPVEVLRHLERCRGCAAHLEQARQFEGTLAGVFHRWDCPSPVELSDYHLGLVRSTQDRAIMAHLPRCPRCTDEIEDLRTFLAEEEQAATSFVPKPQSRRWLDVLVAQLRRAGPGLQLVGMRSSVTVPFIAKSTAATIVLQVVLTAHETARVLGQIADVAGEQERWKDALVEVRQGGSLVATAFVDDLGEFSFDLSARGETQLRVAGTGGAAIVVEGFAL